MKTIYSRNVGSLNLTARRHSRTEIDNGASLGYQYTISTVDGVLIYESGYFLSRSEAIANGLNRTRRLVSATARDSKSLAERIVSYANTCSRIVNG